MADLLTLAMLPAKNASKEFESLRLQRRTGSARPVSMVA